MEMFNSITGKLIPTNYRKSLSSVQEKLKPELCKKTLSSITFQNKVALRRSLKPANVTLAECIDCEKDFEPLANDYTGPVLKLGDSLDIQFVYKLR